MQKITQKLLIRLIAVLMGLGLAGAPAALSVNRLIVFGDSLSDTGNYFAAWSDGSPLPFQFDEGRASDGPVWVQYLADRLGVVRPEPVSRGGTDYAFFGADMADGIFG